MAEYINKEELIDIVFCSECRYKHKRSDNKLECTKFYKYSNGYEQKRVNKNDFCSKGKRW